MENSILRQQEVSEQGYMLQFLKKLKLCSKFVLETSC